MSMSNEEMKKLQLTPITDYIAEDYGEDHLHDSATCPHCYSKELR